MEVLGAVVISGDDVVHLGGPTVAVWGVGDGLAGVVVAGEDGAPEGGPALGEALGSGGG